MKTETKIILIAAASLWSVWGITCALWTLDFGSATDSILGGIFHLGFYAATIASIFGFGVWLFEEGAEDIAAWWDGRRKNEAN